MHLHTELTYVYCTLGAKTSLLNGQSRVNLRGFDREGWASFKGSCFSLSTVIKTNMKFFKRDENGKFVKKISWKVKGYLFLTFLVGVMTVSHIYVEPLIDQANDETRKMLDKVSKEVSYVAAPKVEAAEIAPDKIEKAKDKVLDELAKCESGGIKEEDGITILDSNNVGSYGPFQFQRKTVMHYYKQMTGEKINGRDAIILALKREEAQKLAKYIIFQTKAGVAQDWVNCSRIHGLQAKVDLLKSIEE